MKYLYIRAWGKMSGSLPWYIERQVEQAKADNAPETAIYKRQDGSWATFGSVRSGVTRDNVAKIVRQMQEEAQA